MNLFIATSMSGILFMTGFIFMPVISSCLMNFFQVIGRLVVDRADVIGSLEISSRVLVG